MSCFHNKKVDLTTFTIHKTNNPRLQTTQQKVSVYSNDINQNVTVLLGTIERLFGTLSEILLWMLLKMLLTLLLKMLLKDVVRDVVWGVV